MTYLIEYLGEFKFIFETVLGYVSGDQMGSFEAKKNGVENLMLGHLQGNFNIPYRYCHGRRAVGQAD